MSSLLKNKKISQKVIILSLYIFFSLLYSFRFLFLDADLSDYNQAGVQPLDELYYNEIGVLLSREGWNILFSGDLYDVSLANTKLFLIPNLISAVTFNLLGMNYYGLRIGYTIMGMVSGCFLINITQRIVGINWKYLYLVAAFYLLDFNLLLLSRSGTNVIPCMLSLLVLLQVLISHIDIRKKSFWLGFLPVFFLFVIYANMPFLITFSFLYVIYEIIILKRNVRDIVTFYILGIISALLTCEILDYSILHNHVYNIFIDTLSAQVNKVNNSFFDYFINVRYFLFSNMFKYNSLLLFELLAVMPLAVLRIKKNRDEISFILVAILVLHYVQTIFLNNATPQKSTISYPLVILLILYFVKEQFSFAKKSKLYRLYMLFVACFSIFVILYSNETFPAFNYNIRIILYTFMCISLLLLLIITNMKRRILFASSIILLCFAFLNYEYVFSNKTYTDLNMMKELDSYSGMNNVISTKGVCLYNNTTSKIDAYDKYKGKGYNQEYVVKETRKLLEQYGDIYFLSYSSTDNNYVLTGIKELNVRTIEDKKFIRNYKIGGKDANLSMFHILMN